VYISAILHGNPTIPLRCASIRHRERDSIHRAMQFAQRDRHLILSLSLVFEHHALLEADAAGTSGTKRARDARF
jgi:hypothetical protein